MLKKNKRSPDKTYIGCYIRIKQKDGLNELKKYGITTTKYISDLLDSHLPVDIKKAKKQYKCKKGNKLI